MRQLRLVKVIVQPVVVLDEDGLLKEVIHDPVAIPASEWSEYSGKRFPAEFDAWQRRLDSGEPIGLVIMRPPQGGLPPDA